MNCCVSQISHHSPDPTPITTANPMGVTDDVANYNPRLYDDPEAAIAFFPSEKFYRKRASRLAPVYCFTNLLAIPMVLMLAGVGVFIYTLIVSLFLISSWLLATPLNGVLWTISTMAFFYCMFPHLIVRLQRMQTAQDFRY